MTTEQHNSLQKEEWLENGNSFYVVFHIIMIDLLSSLSEEGSLKNYYLACFKSILFSSHVFEMLGRKMD